VLRGGANGDGDYRVFRRDLLRAADRIDGPAIVEERTSTTVLHAGDVLRVGVHGELIVDTSGAPS
jgi:N-methylhydantoinase A